MQADAGYADVLEPKFLEQLQIPCRFSAAKDLSHGKDTQQNSRNIETQDNQVHYHKVLTNPFTGATCRRFGAK